MESTKTVPQRRRDPKTMTRRILAELAAERASHGHGEAARIDRRMGKSKGYLGRILRGELRLDVETLFQALEALEADPVDFFARAAGTRIRPERLLARLERRAADEGPSVLDRFELRFDGDEVEVLVETAGGSAGLAELAGRLGELEVKSFSDPRETLAEAEDALVDAARCLRAEDGAESRETVCRLLGLVAAIYRRTARFGSAARCLRRAFELNAAEELPPVRAELLQRACYLLADQGDYEIALEVVREATEIYIWLEDDVGLAKALVDRGGVLTALGEIPAAIEAYERGLEHLPEDLWHSRSTAQQGLGFCYMHLGTLEKATQHALAATKLHRTRRGPNWARLVWLRGEVALKTRDLKSAEKFLRMALDALGEMPNLLDVAVVSLRLAQALLLDERLAEVHQIAAGLLRLLHPLRHHRIASAAIAEVTRASLSGEITLELLDDACLELEKEDGRPAEGRPPEAA